MRMGYWAMRHWSTQVQRYWGDRLVDRAGFEDWLRCGVDDRGVRYWGWGCFEYWDRSCGDKRRA